MSKKFKGSRVAGWKSFMVAGLLLASLYLFNPLTLKPVFAQTSFYQGKTMTIVVGFLVVG